VGVATVSYDLQENRNIARLLKEVRKKGAVAPLPLGYGEGARVPVHVAEARAADGR
jgi:hypothetical protein